ncbi:MAG: Ig-like domain-containing protein [bacterium]|nr:Ig-like domain-containing protein [bacterium]
MRHFFRHFIILLMVFGIFSACSTSGGSGVSTVQSSDNTDDDESNNEDSLTVPTSLSLSASSPTVYIGLGRTYTVSAEPNGANNAVTWAIDDDEIATISAGVVTGLSEGTTVITATSILAPGVVVTQSVTIDTVEWNEKTSLTEARYGSQAVTMDGGLYLISGRVVEYDSKVQYTDDGGDSWSVKVATANFEKRVYHSAYTDGDALCVWAGVDKMAPPCPMCGLQMMT